MPARQSHSGFTGQGKEILYPQDSPGEDTTKKLPKPGEQTLYMLLSERQKKAGLVLTRQVFIVHLVLF